MYTTQQCIDQLIVLTGNVLRVKGQGWLRALELTDSQAASVLSFLRDTTFHAARLHAAAVLAGEQLLAHNNALLEECRHNFRQAVCSELGVSATVQVDEMASRFAGMQAYMFQDWAREMTERAMPLSHA